MKRESPSRCGRYASCEGGDRAAENWMVVGASRHRYLRNPQRLFPRKDSLPRGGGAGLPLKKANAFFKGTRGGGSKQPALLPSALPIYIHLSAQGVCKSPTTRRNP